jgi:hypothetical protein
VREQDRVGCDRLPWTPRSWRYRPEQALDGHP